MIGDLLSFIFPKICVFCRKEGDLLCRECFSEILLKPAKYETYPFSKIFTATTYNEKCKRLIKCLKYSFYKDLSNPLGELLCKCIPMKFTEKPIVVPIPLHWTRRIYRGFNQAELLADIVANKLNIQKKNLLIRKKKTKPQARQSKSNRLSNLENAFEISKKIQSEIPISTSILLIDDVATTFSTLRSAANCLKKNGYMSIFGAAIAHGN